MSTRLFLKTKQFVAQAFIKAEGEPSKHSEETVDWILKLKPDADEALLIAAVAHDIERAIYGDWKKGSDDPVALRKHQDQSAAVIEEFLKKEGADEKLIARVKMLVAHHEEGGNEDQNLLCDADCLSFLQSSAPRLAGEPEKYGGAEEVKRRINMVSGRIRSDKAREMAMPFYNEAMEKLRK